LTGAVSHIITGLNVGGAELVLAKLVRTANGFTHSVVSLTDGGVIGDALAREGVPVHHLGMRKDPRGLLDMARLGSAIQGLQPDMVQTWLYHADLAGGLAAWKNGIPVVWNLRQTEVDRGAHKINTRIVIRLCALLSTRIPRRIVCGSNAALGAHVRMGFDRARMLVIGNGVDTRTFCPVRDEGLDFRAGLGIGRDALVVGRVGRFHPQKDYAGFIDMAARVARELPGAVFVMAGEGVEEHNRELLDLIDGCGLRERVRLLGRSSEVPRIMRSLDVLVSSSAFGEGFPNVVAEGMASGVPAVATDVGDSAELIHDPGRVVAPRDYSALARSVVDVLALAPEARRALGMRDRERIRRHYDVDAMVARYEALYHDVVKRRS